jgi:Mu-like prophage protein gp46
MDAALTFLSGSFNADIRISKGDLVREEDLETAITLSLFSDRRAAADDPIEKGESLRGWWGDTFAEVKNDKFGSKLWLLRREKQLQSVLDRAKQYAQESLQWLIDDRVASKVLVITEIVGEKPSGILGIRIEVTRPTGLQTFQFDYVWNQI